MDAIEIHVAAPMPASHFEFPEGFELRDEANDVATGERGFVGEPVERRPGPAGVGVDVGGNDQQQRTGRSSRFA